ncbi:hypothetical protein DFH09DRAFT_1320060 [Mycena vulgaris]|nr:hypothetical protein DFH09DRAFT_1320060 [Mycena vulgaris]
MYSALLKILLSFPLELERRIFELTTVSHPVAIPTLLRVAWHVKHWVEPLLYRTLVFGAADTIEGITSRSMVIFTHVASSKSAAFLRDSVRNLMLFSMILEQTRTILSICTGVENLYILVSAIPDLSPLSAVEITSLRHITHLELFNGASLVDTGSDAADYAGIAGLPNLTHLAFSTHRVLPSCLHLLDACKSLRVLVILGSQPPVTSQLPGLSILAQDPRFIIIPLFDYDTDWQRGVVLGVDYWQRAEVLIAKRVSGEVDRQTYSFDEEESN